MDPFSSPDALRLALRAAEGYAELGLTDLAWEELTRLSASERATPGARELMLGLYIREERWEEAVRSGLEWCAAGDGFPGSYIHTAYALHETGRTREASRLLQEGPPALREDPLFHYNMACYLAVSGALQEASAALQTAFRMDEKLRRFARTDPDLKALHGKF